MPEVTVRDVIVQYVRDHQGCDAKDVQTYLANVRHLNPELDLTPRQITFKMSDARRAGQIENRGAHGMGGRWYTPDHPQERSSQDMHAAISVSARVLITELRLTLTEIEAQIETIKDEATQLKVDPYGMRDANGNWCLAPLLAGKAQALSALAALHG